MGSFFRAYWRSLLWFLLIGVLLLIPGDNLPSRSYILFEHTDKVVHFGLFLILQGLYLWESAWLFKVIRPVQIVLSLFGFSGYAVVTEIVQYLCSSERSGDWLDGLADVTGLVAGVFLYRAFFPLISRYFPRKHYTPY